MSWAPPRASGLAGLVAAKNPYFVRQKSRHGGYLKIGAGNETRTRDPDLGKVVLYQLSYSRFDEGRILNQSCRAVQSEVAY